MLRMIVEKFPAGRRRPAALIGQSDKPAGLGRGDEGVAAVDGSSGVSYAMIVVLSNPTILCQL